MDQIYKRATARFLLLKNAVNSHSKWWDRRELRRNFALKAIVACSFGCVIAALPLIGFTVWMLRSDALRDAIVETNTTTAILADQTFRSVQSIDLMVSQIEDHLQFIMTGEGNVVSDALSGQKLFLYLRAINARLGADVISLSDKHGRIVNYSREWPAPPIDLSEREFHSYLKERYDTRLHIAKPIIGTISNRPLLFFSKRLSASDGVFEGMISIGVSPSYFKDVYKAATIELQRNFLLLRADGTILVSYPDEADIGKKVALNSPWQFASAIGGGYFSL